MQQIMMASSTNKRRRTAADTLNISDLPVGFIVNVSEYLPKPSRAILAVALSAPSSSWKINDDLNQPISTISKAIVSAQSWNTLDFEDIEGKLSNKLTDDDVYAILKCINAHDVLKKLKLCGCINITGIGLYPLRSSVVLEQIDLSLVGKYIIDGIQWPWQESAKMSHQVVLPVLDSIIAADECSLKYIQFPVNWCPGRRTRIPQVHRFIERYNELLSTRDMICSKCEEDMLHTDWMDGHARTSNRMGALIRNNNFCYDCLEPICHDCSDGSNNESFSSKVCTNCEKTFCSDCVPIPKCACCSDEICKGCEDMKACDECEEVACEKCLNTCNVCNRIRCEDCAGICYCGPEDYKCSKSHCTDCYNGKEYDVKFCEECENMSCSSCNLKNIKENGMNCGACAGDVVQLMLDEMDKLRKENEELREKVESK